MITPTVICSISESQLGQEVGRLAIIPIFQSFVQVFVTIVSCLKCHKYPYMLIKDIHRFVKTLSKFSMINEGFYAYHCTRADLENFTDAEHNNVTSGNGQYYGYGTYFEILDKNENAMDYLVDEKAGGKQYKVYIDLKDNQLLDLDKSFRENGKSLSVEEVEEFFNVEKLPSSFIKGKCSNFKEAYDDFYDFSRKNKKMTSSKSIINPFINLIENANHLVNLLNQYNKSKKFRVNLFLKNDEIEKLRRCSFLLSIYHRYKFSNIDDLINFIQEKYPDQMENLNEVLPYIREKGGFEGIIEMMYDMAPNTKNIIPILINNIPLKIVLETHTFEKQIKWIRKHFDVWGKIVSETSRKSGKPCKYLILWKTKGIAKIVGHRKRRENDLDKQFTDEIEDEKEQDMISGMLDYAG